MFHCFIMQGSGPSLASVGSQSDYGWGYGWIVIDQRTLHYWCNEERWSRPSSPAGTDPHVLRFRSIAVHTHTRTHTYFMVFCCTPMPFTFDCHPSPHWFLSLLIEDTRLMSQTLAWPEPRLHYRVLIAWINAYCRCRTHKFSSPHDL